MKRLIFICTIALCAMAAVWAEPLKLNPDYRPLKIKIFWAGSDDVRAQTVYEYNRKGQLIKASLFRDEKTPAGYDTFEYDEKGNLAKKSTFYPKGLNSYVTFTYLANRLYEETEYQPDKTITRVVRYEYDRDGKLYSVSLKRVPYNGKNLEWESMDVYGYDAQKRITEIMSYSAGTLTNKTVYEYSQNRLLLTYVWYGDNRDSNLKTVTEYKYATKNQQIERLESVSQKRVYVDQGKEEIDCCVSYTTKTELNSGKFRGSYILQLQERIFRQGGH